MLAMPSKTRNRRHLIRFLDHLDTEIPVVEGDRVVAVTDNLSTRAPRKCRSGSRRIRVGAFRFAPKHASWLNQRRRARLRARIGPFVK